MPQQQAKRRYYIDILERRLADPDEERSRKLLYATQIGHAYAFLREFDRAEKSFRAAMRLDPSKPYPYEGLGNLAMVREQYREAVGWYEKGIAAEPGRPVDTPYLRAAEAHHRLGNWQGAVEMCQRALLVCPDSQGATGVLEHLRARQF